MNKIFYTLLILASLNTFSQLKTTGYFNAEIGISYQFSNKFQTELRVNDNLFSEFSTELSLLYQFVNKEDYNLNIGFGVNSLLFREFDRIESLLIPLQLEITPFKNIKNLGFVIEAAYHFAEQDYGLRNSVGIRYIFN